MKTTPSDLSRVAKLKNPSLLARYSCGGRPRAFRAVQPSSLRLVLLILRISLELVQKMHLQSNEQLLRSLKIQVE
jgi:hypothetical protein